MRCFNEGVGRLLADLVEMEGGGGGLVGYERRDGHFVHGEVG